MINQQVDLLNLKNNKDIIKYIDEAIFSNGLDEHLKFIINKITSEDNTAILSALLKNKSYTPTENYSLILHSAAQFHSFNSIKLILKDGRCTASDCFNNIINANLPFEIFDFIFNHPSFNQTLKNDLIISKLSVLNTEDSKKILQLIMNAGFFSSKEDLVHSLINCASRNFIDNFHIIFNSGLIIGNELDNKIIKEAINKENFILSNLLFSIPKVRETLEPDYVSKFKVLKVIHTQANF